MAIRRLVTFPPSRRIVGVLSRLSARLTARSSPLPAAAFSSSSSSSSSAKPAAAATTNGNGNGNGGVNGSERLQLVFRPPVLEDAEALERIATESGAEAGTRYHYLLFAKHFGQDGCLVVEDTKNQVIGFALAYRPPSTPETVFVWQICIDENAQKMGIGKQLLLNVAYKAAQKGNVRFLEGTATPSNVAYRNLLKAVARDMRANCTESKCFVPLHFASGHEAEDLFRIGPFTAQGAGAAAAAAGMVNV